jgi:uncharacterized repeat protein (TIGR01451 family)
MLSGSEIWMSETGDPGTFEQINIGGMDGSMTLPPLHPDSNMSGADQDGVRTFATYKGYLIAGTTSFVECLSEELSHYAEMEAPVNNTVRFKCEIRNIGSCNLTDISVQNCLSLNLEYAENATMEPARYASSLMTGNTMLEWDIPYLSLGESIVIEYDADVVRSVIKDLDYLYARGYCKDNDQWDNEYDIVIVNAT